MDYIYSTIIQNDSLRMTVTDSNGVVKVYDADVVSINSNWLYGKTYIVVQGAYNNLSDGVVTNTGDEQSDTTQSVAVGDKIEFILLKEPDTFSPDPQMSRVL